MNIRMLLFPIINDIICFNYFSQPSMMQQMATTAGGVAIGSVVVSILFQFIRFYQFIFEIFQFTDFFFFNLRVTLSLDYSQAVATQKKLRQLLQLNQLIANNQHTNNNKHKMDHAHGKSNNSCNAQKIKPISPFAKVSMKLSVNAKPRTIWCKSNI